jgi:hypothetical protein
VELIGGRIVLMVICSREKIHFGDYQPAQKWLKDRKGIVLSFEDIMHYQEIIVTLADPKSKSIFCFPEL